MPRHLLAVSPEQLDLASYRIKPYWNWFFKGYSIPTEGVEPNIIGMMTHTQKK
jgi:hypothetical protein